MAGLNLRIVTKLGLSAGITLGPVGGMHANQLHGHPSIGETSRSISASHSSKSSAQAADTGMMRAPLAIRATRAARSAVEFDQGLAASAQVLASAWLLSNESGRLKTDVENFLDSIHPA